MWEKHKPKKENPIKLSHRTSRINPQFSFKTKINFLNFKSPSDADGFQKAIINQIQHSAVPSVLDFSFFLANVFSD